MQVMVLDRHDDLTALRPLFLEWEKEWRGADFAITGDMETILDTVRKHVLSEHADFLVLLDASGAIAGCMGLRLQANHMGSGLFAVEGLFFVKPGCRGGGILLRNAARQWARARKCSHLQMTASRLATKAADVAERFFVASGMKQLETTFVEVL